jgi:hypothetical protein
MTSANNNEMTEPGAVCTQPGCVAFKHLYVDMDDRMDIPPPNITAHNPQTNATPHVDLKGINEHNIIAPYNM